MHAIVHLLSKKPLTYQDIELIMAPYDESNVYSEYEEDADGNEIVKSVIYPQFTWDYYTIHDPVIFHDIKDCYVLIDPDGWCIARKWWNGRKHIDQRFDFELYIEEHRRE